MTSAILLSLEKKEKQQLIIRNLRMKCQLSVSIGITNFFFFFPSNEINDSEIEIYLLASVSAWQTSMHTLAAFLKLIFSMTD